MNDKAKLCAVFACRLALERPVVRQEFVAAIDKMIATFIQTVMYDGDIRHALVRFEDIVNVEYLEIAGHPARHDLMRKMYWILDTYVEEELNK